MHRILVQRRQRQLNRRRGVRAVARIAQRARIQLQLLFRRRVDQRIVLEADHAELVRPLGLVLSLEAALR